MKILFGIIISIVSFLSLAEYRVYQYYVRTKVNNLTPTTPYLVTSTLDPKSYVTYHGGSDSLEVSLLRSWMCLGNTARTEVCTISEGSEFDERVKK